MWTTDNMVTLSIMTVFVFYTLRLFAAHREAAVVVAKQIKDMLAEQEAKRQAKAARSAANGTDSGPSDVTIV